MDYDLKITGGTILDGTGAEAFAGDIAIKDGIIVAVGQAPGSATRTIDAKGLLVTPGFIDMHTHYDAQALWDTELETSTRHGVTTAFMGNCGVGFAPLKPETKDTVIKLMAGVEDIPGKVLRTGLKWDWGAFGEYLDRLDEVERPIDIAAQVPHDNVRLYVMGERAAAQEMATPEDIEAMKAVVRDSLLAGAFAFSFGRVFGHKMSNGQTTPSYKASHDELEALAGVLKDLPYRVLQGITDGRANEGPDAFDAEFEVVTRMITAAGRPMSFNMHQRPEPQHHGVYLKILAKADELNARGESLRFQVGGRGGGSMLGLTSSVNPLAPMPSYRAIADLPLDERLTAMQDPAFRARILSEEPLLLDGEGGAMRSMHALLTDLEAKGLSIFPIARKPKGEPSRDNSITGLAKAAGKPPFEVLFDLAISDEGEMLFDNLSFNYAAGNLSAVHTMLTHPNTLFGLADAGAHLGYVCENGYTTFALKFWAQERTLGPTLPLPQVVNMLTGKIADHFGLADRGRIKVGLRADINVIDYDNLHLDRPRAVFDLPAGGRRFVQHSHGYRAVIAAGQPIIENDVPTGAKPGKVLRAAAA
jgi:N-acyl-D-aspartate/D-glutamate deacylase